MTDSIRQITVAHIRETEMWLHTSVAFVRNPDHFAELKSELEAMQLFGEIASYDIAGSDTVVVMFDTPDQMSTLKDDVLQAFALGTSGIDNYVDVYNQGEVAAFEHYRVGTHASGERYIHSTKEVTA